MVYKTLIETDNLVLERLRAFRLDGEPIICRRFGGGHINDTYLVVDDTARAYILQKINRGVFRDPLSVMRNIAAVTSYLARVAEDPRGVLELVPARERNAAEASGPDETARAEAGSRVTNAGSKSGADDGNRATTASANSRAEAGSRATTASANAGADDGSSEPLWIVDGDGEYWRMYSFISDSVCYQHTRSGELLRESGAAFGAFQRSLAEFPARELCETIPRFHDTPNRYAAFKAALDSDAHGRAKYVGREIDFILEREEYAGVLMSRRAEGALPLRVTHNDTKLNNVLFDRRTKKSLCVIDLDTVMPGLSVLDFGDSIRFGASTAAEDERDLDKVSFSQPLFEAYAEGFLSVCGESLTECEIDSLCDGAAVITLENGVRFLTDYLSGDVYYRVSYDGHNLDRCRTQLKLVACMESRRDAMQSAIARIASRASLAYK